MMRRAEVRMAGGAVEEVHRALAPEGGRDVPRSRVALDRDGQDLVLRVQANDTGALRAALNSYLRWMALAQTVVDEVKG